MDPTKILSDEHRIIEKVLLCVEKLARDAQEKSVLDAEGAAMALRFITNYADHWHHQKEEGCLFPVLETRGMPSYEGPVAVMLQEHEIGRGHVKGMRAAVEQARSPAAGEGGTGAAKAAAAFAVDARGYVSLLRDHIAKEDQVLYPMAMQMLSSNDCAELCQQFTRKEAEIPEAESGKALVALAGELQKRCGVEG